MYLYIYILHPGSRLKAILVQPMLSSIFHFRIRMHFQVYRVCRIGLCIWFTAATAQQGWNLEQLGIASSRQLTFVSGLLAAINYLQDQTLVFSRSKFAREVLEKLYHSQSQIVIQNWFVECLRVVDVVCTLAGCHIKIVASKKWVSSTWTAGGVVFYQTKMSTHAICNWWIQCFHFLPSPDRASLRAHAIVLREAVKPRPHNCCVLVHGVAELYFICASDVKKNSNVQLTMLCSLRACDSRLMMDQKVLDPKLACRSADISRLSFKMRNRTMSKSWRR